jgi:hypothetical protein
MRLVGVGALERLEGVGAETRYSRNARSHRREEYEKDRGNHCDIVYVP